MLYSEYFIHPKDAEALNALKSIPAFPMLTKKFSEIFHERTAKIENLSSHLRISERQLPEIYEMLPPICEQLEIPVPELYLVNDPYINACTMGDTTPCIRLNSGLITNCSPDVIKVVIAHECGHIVCHHVLYKVMANFFCGIAGSLINIPFLSYALKYALLYWDRCSEYSADRAAAYACGGSEPVVKTMTALASSSNTLLDKVDHDEFLKQAEEFKEFNDSSAWNKFLMYWLLLDLDHPFVVDRAADIVEWCNSDEYRNLCDGVPYTEYSYEGDRCPKCGAHLAKDAKFCSACGAKVKRCQKCGAVFTEEDSFCDKCGEKL